MRRMYITIIGRVERESDAPDDLGRVLTLDWDSRTILDGVEVVGTWQVHEGRSRGARGIVWFEGNLWIATSTTLHCYVPDTFQSLLRIQPGKDEPGYYADIHGLSTHDDSLYVVCTGLESVVVVKNNEVVEKRPVSNSPTRTEGGPGKPILERNFPYNRDKLHFNSLAHQPGTGKEFHVYYSPGELFNYSDKKVVTSEWKGKGAHGLLFVSPTEAVTCLSDIGAVAKVHVDTGHNEILFQAEIDRSKEWAIHGYLRGMDFNGGSLYVVSTEAVYQLDAQTGEIQDQFDFPDPIREGASFELLLDPRDWG